MTDLRFTMETSDRHSVFRVTALPALIVVLVLLGTAATAAAQTLSFDPAASSVDCGGQVDVDLIISDVSDLQGYSLIFQVDPGIVAVDAVTLGPQYVAACATTPFLNFAYDSGTGVLRVDSTLLGCSWDTPTPETLLTITFSPGATKATSALALTGSSTMRDSNNGLISFTPPAAGSVTNLCNTAPVVVPDTFNLDENSANGTAVGSVSASDYDSSDILTYAITAGNGLGGFVIDTNTGDITVADAGILDFETTPSFALTVTVTDNDPSPLSGSATITIDLNDLNEAPVLGGIGGQTIAELDELTFTATATDVDLPSQTLTYSLDSAAIALGMAIDGASGVFTWTPAEAQGPGSFPATITVSDGTLTDNETINIDVTEVNVAPVLGGIGNQTIAELTELTFTATATDLDDPTQTLTFSLDAAAIAFGMAIDGASGAFTWTPSEDQGPGAFAATITVSDGTLTDDETINIDVTEVNVAPVLGGIGNQTIAELTELTFTATATDADSPPQGLTYSLDATAMAAGMVIVPGTGVFTWTPAEDQGPGTFPVTITVSDGNMTDDETINIDVTEVNVAPVLGGIGNQTIAELTELTFTATATDADLPPQGLTYSLDAAAIAFGMAIDGNSGVFTWTPTEAQGPGNFPATVTVSDGTMTDDETINIEVTEVNVAPVVADIPDQSISEGQLFVQINLDDHVTDPDHDDDQLTWIASGQTALTVSIVNRVATITAPSLEWNGSETVTFTATDPGSLDDADDATFTVTGVNDAPVVTNPGPQFNTVLDTPTLQIVASDLENNNLSYDATGLPNGLTINTLTGEISGTIACDAVTGTVQVTVTDDGTPAESTAVSFLWTIDPIAVPATLSDLASTQITAGNDSDGTTKIHLTWTVPTDTAAEIAIYRKGFGFYPEYDDAGGSEPTLPLTTWTLVDGNVPADAGEYFDEPSMRDFWYYAAVVANTCGGLSAPSNLTGGSLNYHLGDVSDGVTAGDGDNLVNSLDISLLGNSYALPTTPTTNYLDVGPTTDLWVDSRPTTDNMIEFEDLIIFAINFQDVSKNLDGPEPANRNELTVFVPREPESDGKLQVSLWLAADGSLKGTSIPLTWNPDVVNPVGYQPGSLVAAQSGQGLVLSPAPGTVDFALFGSAEEGISGEGVLATVTFEVLKEGDADIQVGEIRARDMENKAQDLDTTVALGTPDTMDIPLVSFLNDNYPNPFNPMTNFKYGVAAEGRISIAVYDVRGRMVTTLLDEIVRPGTYTIVWDGTDSGGRRVSSGVYLARFKAVDQTQVQRMTLVK